MLSKIIQQANEAIYRRHTDDNIIKWAERNIILGHAHGEPGPLRLDRSRWLHQPLLDFEDRSVAELACVKATQTGGTLLGEICLQWAMVNRPGSMQWFCQSDTKAEEQMIDRIKPVLMLNKAIKHLLPKDDRKISATGVTIPGTTLVVTGHADNDIQSATRHIVFVDELAHYDDSTTLYEIKARTGYTSEMGNSKVLIISQAGDADGELDKSYRDGTMEEWQVPCESCGQFFLPKIMQFSAEGYKFSEHPIQIKDEKGRYNMGKLEKVLTLDCPHCQHQHRDSIKLKNFWNEKGTYIQTNPTPLKGHKSYNWGSIHCRRWIDIAKEWIDVCDLRKNGNGQKEYKEFLQKKMAQTVDMKEFIINTRTARTDTPYELSWPDEFTRNMAIDVQQDRFFASIRAYAKMGESRQLFCNWLYTIDQVLAVQKEYNIPYYTDKTGKKTYSVLWDTGFAKRQSEIYLYCVTYNHLAIKGDTSGTKQFDNWVMLNGKKINIPRQWSISTTRGDPYAGQRMQGKGPTCPLVLLATDTLKKTLVQLRNKQGPEWLCLPREQNPAYDDYIAGIYNEEFYTESKRGQPLKEGRWEKINPKLTNEAFDVEAYSIGAALMAGVKFNLINHLPSNEYLMENTKPVVLVNP